MIKAKTTRIASSERYKFDDLYNSIDDCIHDLMLIDFNDKYKIIYLKGYQYAKSFYNQIKAGKKLTDKQITMLKRIAREIVYYLVNIQKIK